MNNVWMKADIASLRSSLVPLLFKDTSLSASIVNLQNDTSKMIRSDVDTTITMRYTYLIAPIIVLGGVLYNDSVIAKRLCRYNTSKC